MTNEATEEHITTDLECIQNRSKHLGVLFSEVLEQHNAKLVQQLLLATQLLTQGSQGDGRR